MSRKAHAKASRLRLGTAMCIECNARASDPCTAATELDLQEGAADFSWVKTNYLVRLIVMVFALAGSAFAAHTGVVSMGDDTYSVTREAPNTFKRDTEPLKQAAMEEAEKFCR